jgi:hydrogenase expression/formation protein HypE
MIGDSSYLLPTAAATVTFRDPQIEMSHGAGGTATRRLVEGLLMPILRGPAAGPLGDAAFMQFGQARIAMTADSFVVRPLRFPGGSIGELAVNGTVNDLAVSGAIPRALLITFVLEAGLPVSVLEDEVRAIATAAAKAGIEVVGGDTKVVEHGKADGMYITTAGIGLADPRAALGPSSVRPGDQILLSGHIGDHGCTVLLARGQVDLDATIVSDTRSVWPFIDRVLDVAGPHVRWMRDATRGGVATVLNELARDTHLACVLDENRVPVRDEVRGVCELLGLDPLHIANEGQFVAIVAPAGAGAAVAAIRSLPGGEAADIVGDIRETPAGMTIAVPSYGGARVIDMLVGDPLPRIC